MPAHAITPEIDGQLDIALDVAIDQGIEPGKFGAPKIDFAVIKQFAVDLYPKVAAGYDLLKNALPGEVTTAVDKTATAVEATAAAAVAIYNVYRKVA